jgi:hypothetical protein
VVQQLEDAQGDRRCIIIYMSAQVNIALIVGKCNTADYTRIDEGKMRHNFWSFWITWETINL